MVKQKLLAVSAIFLLFLLSFFPEIIVSVERTPSWSEVQPTVLADDDQTTFWTLSHSGSGSICVSLSNDTRQKQHGRESLKIESSSGSYAYFDIYHEFADRPTWREHDVFILWWCGANTGAQFRLHIQCPDLENRYYYDFYDSFWGWQEILLHFDQNFTGYGNPSLCNVGQIRIGLETENQQGTWRLDYVFIDIISKRDPRTYLSCYEWALNRLNEHRHGTVKQVRNYWDGRTGKATTVRSRFDLTLPTFLEAYKITGNGTYLSWARESFDAGITYLYEPSTHLFALEYNDTLGDKIDNLDLLFAAILLNAMFDFYSVTQNSTHLSYAKLYADALHAHGFNITTRMPHREIKVSDGSTLQTDVYVEMQYGRFIGAFVKGYEVCGNETYLTWAKETALAFWNKRNATTNLYPCGLYSNGTIELDYNMPNLDPIQNPLLYGYDVTYDPFFLNLARDITDAQLRYGWNSSLNRMVKTISTRGKVLNAELNLIQGPQLYIVGLLQLYHYTDVATYRTKALTFWDTLHEHALVNNVWCEELDENNVPNDEASLYCHHMMAQADAFLYHFTKNQKYLDDLKNTVNNYILYFTCDHGTVAVVDTDTKGVIDAGTYDWLDSTTYVFGSAIYFFSVYSTQNSTTVERDLTYYAPYFPVLRLAGTNYSNNELSFEVMGSTTILLDFVFPRGKTIDTVTTNVTSTIFAYVENASQLSIPSGRYTVKLKMKNGFDVFTLDASNFSNQQLTLTVSGASGLATLKVYCAKEETPNYVLGVSYNLSRSYSSETKYLNLTVPTSSSRTVTVGWKPTLLGIRYQGITNGNLLTVGQNNALWRLTATVSCTDTKANIQLFTKGRRPRCIKVDGQYLASSGWSYDRSTKILTINVTAASDLEVEAIFGITNEEGATATFLSVLMGVLATVRRKIANFKEKHRKWIERGLIMAFVVVVFVQSLWIAGIYVGWF